MNQLTVLRAYYAATLVFLLLDYLLDINVRLTFLENQSVLKALYYVLCFACLGLMIWRPDWELVVGTIESVLSLSLLLLAMGVRVMTVSDQVLTGAAAPVSGSEVINFIIVGGAAWISWNRGMTELTRRTRER